MAKIVEPPVLISRILAFMLAASVVVLAVLVIALAKMIPLERPEVFFLVSPSLTTNFIIEPLVPDTTDKTALGNYEKGFIRQYVIARNTLYTNPILTKNNWAKIVKPWSDKKTVLPAFMNTALYKDYNFSDTPMLMSCSVNFSNIRGDEAILRVNDNEYTVNFAWICENIGGQSTQKNYKIKIKIKSSLYDGIKGTLDNLRKLNENPLGIQVAEYTVINGTDPLDSDRTSW